MTDFAGPGLGAVGAVIGGVFGRAVGAQWGWTIGATLGGVYAQSQQVIPGPKIGDVQRQTQQEGGFRPIVYGRSHPIAGTVIADGGPVIVKAAAPEGRPEGRDRPVYARMRWGLRGRTLLQAAERHSVYDAEDPSMAAEREVPGVRDLVHRIIDQPASPDLEEVYGVGQAPYFRGTAYLSLHNDVTDQRGAWSQWQLRVPWFCAILYTPPYPVTYSYLGILVRRKGGHYTFPVGHVGGFACLGGVLKDVLLSYVSPPEELDISSMALGGTLAKPILHYDYEPEPLDISSVALGGDLKVVLLRYQNYEPESLGISSVALGGTLT